ncbi:MmcB family DNA repair protein [Parvularcula sp. LCG005]|uniref:MmcB family DNA repair protein n=1 Tax=Parvularcula sp. LCG005 TaxID=3078805 RepID=UPI00294265B9|nr:MmcB family DNA repair protein [Parvularcula sp. LCG005]WOI53494.1 MmcB family DNA repair protein [Parvularcula sp. LCG005]
MLPDPSSLAALQARPDVTEMVTRGVCRILLNEGCAVLTEFTLANGRRADVVGLCPKGIITIVEVKSCRADFEVDAKWQDYLDYCDRFFFAVDECFPREILPDEEGLMIADGFGGATLRPTVDRKLAAGRRKAVTLRFARQAAFAATGR